MEVDLYLGRTDLPQAETQRLARLLDDFEAARAARFKRKADRDRFVVRRGRLREVLARRLGKHPARLSFEQGPFGKPALAGEKTQFSLAHSAGRMMIAICDVEIGCDLERIDPLFDWQPVAEAFFSIGERDYLARLPAAAGTRLFFDWWARKEAVVKAIGHGLSYPAEDIDVSAATSQASALSKDWSIAPIAAVPGFAAALAVPAAAAALRIRISA